MFFYMTNKFINNKYMTECISNKFMHFLLKHI